MTSGPSAEMRLRAAAAIRQKRSASIDKIKDRVAALEKEVATGTRSRASITHGELFKPLDVSRASYFRYLKDDRELSEVVERLFGIPSDRIPPLDQNGAQDQPHSSSDGKNLRLECASLKRQVAACRVFISSLEMDRSAKTKDLRSRDVSITQLKHQNHVLAARLASVEAFLDGAGYSLDEVYSANRYEDVDGPMGESPEWPTQAQRVKPRHLKVVQTGTEERDL